MSKSRTSTSFSRAVITVLALTLIAQPSAAAACNTAGCWNSQITRVWISGTGLIWFMIEDPSKLAILNSCTVGVINPGPAVFIRPDDSDREQKYLLLMTAWNTGALVGFTVEPDPANNNQCAVLRIDIK